MKKTKLYVTIGVLMGALVGFVFGLASASPENTLTTAGKAKGNVSELAKYRYGNVEAESAQEDAAKSDSLKHTYTVTDENGESWKMTIEK